MSDEYEFSHTLDKHTATVADAVSLLKRTLSKVAKSTKFRTTVIVPREALVKVAKAIDRSRGLYPDPIGDFIHFNGVSIVAEEGGAAALTEASTLIRTRQGISLTNPEPEIKADHPDV